HSTIIHYFSILLMKFYNTLSENEKSKFFRFSGDGDYFKLASTLLRYIDKNDPIAREFMLRLSNSNDGLAFYSFSQILKHDFDKFINFYGIESIEVIFENISNNLENVEKNVVFELLGFNYEKLSENFRLNLVKKLIKTNKNILFFQNRGLESIFLKLPLEFRNNIILSISHISTFLLDKFFENIPEDIKNQVFEKIVTIKELAWFCINFSEKFPEEIKKIFLKNLFNILALNIQDINWLFELYPEKYNPFNNYMFYYFDTLFEIILSNFNKYNEEEKKIIIQNITLKASFDFKCQNLVELSLIMSREDFNSIIDQLLKNKELFSYNLYLFRGVWDKISYDLIVKFIPIIIKEYKDISNNYEFISSNLSYLLKKLSDENLDKIVKLLIEKKVKYKYLLLSLSDNFFKISKELRDKIINNIHGDKEVIYFFIDNLLDKLNKIPDENLNFVFNFFEDEDILERLRFNINYNLEKYSKRVTSKLLENKYTQLLLLDKIEYYPEEKIKLLIENEFITNKTLYSLSKNFDKLSLNNKKYFIDKINNPKYHKKILLSLEYRFPELKENNRIKILEILSESEMLLGKIAILKLIYFDYRTYSPDNNYNGYINIDFIQILLERIYLFDYDIIQKNISKIFSIIFELFDESFRNKVINRILELEKNFIYIDILIKTESAELKKILSKKSDLLLEKLLIDFDANKKYISNIFNMFFTSILKELRESIFFNLLELNENLINLAKILVSNKNEFKIPTKSLYYFANNPESLKIIIKYVFDTYDSKNQELNDFLLYLSSNDNISNFIVWQVINNAKKLEHDVLEKILDNFKNTNNSKTAKCLIFYLFNNENNISDQMKEDIVINLFSKNRFSKSNLKYIVYNHILEIYDKLSINGKNVILDYSSKEFSHFHPIISSILNHKNDKNIEFQSNIIKKLFFENKNMKIISKYFKYNFKLLSESFRNEFITILFTEKDAKVYIVQTIVDNSKKLPIEINNLIIDAFDDNIQQNRVIAENTTIKKKKYILDCFDKYDPRIKDKDILEMFLYDCINNKDKMLDALEKNNFTDKNLMEIIDSLSKSQKTVNFLATTLRNNFHKFQNEIAVKLIEKFIDYKYNGEISYLEDFILDSVKYNIDNVPKEIVDKLIKKLKPKNKWDDDITLGLKKLV
ncbi:MAG: hypothetical protein AABZ74_17460, partial [Cyanobacteriota bacterium]